jgi:hypothetical protein
VQVGIEWRDSGGTAISTSWGVGSSDSTGGWTNVNINSAIAPAAAATARVTVHVIGTGGANEIHYLDAVGLLAGSLYLPGGNGGNTTFDTAGVIAHGGTGGGAAGPGFDYPGGTGSINSVHFPGGAGKSAGGTFGTAGGGGGSSAGPTLSGATGGAASGTTGGVGATAPSGGGAGGGGGNAGGTGAAGSAGTAPGGGGGGAGTGSAQQVGGAGAAGKIQLTYGGARILVASIAGVAGTDVYGNSYPAGIRTNVDTSAGLSGGYYEELTIPATAAGASTTIQLKANATTRLTSDYGSAYNFTTGAWTAPADGVYDIMVGISFPACTLSGGAGTSSRALIDYASGTLSSGTIYERAGYSIVHGLNIECATIMTRYFTAGTIVYLSFFQAGTTSLTSITTRNNTVVFVRRG